MRITALAPRGRAAAMLIGVLLACPATGARAALPLTVSDTRAQDGNITVQTGAWRLVFGEAFNGGPYRWFDLAWPGGDTDNLATASAGGAYSNGSVFDYDVYLGTDGSNAIEFMTTMGSNADPGALSFEIFENTAARVRILQEGHPRLNNGQGPSGDPFPELDLVTTTTVWTLYPTGEIYIDFQADLNTPGMIVDSGPGGAGKGVDAPGCCGQENVLNASGGADFLAAMVWAGDTIESTGGGWGPISIAARTSPTQLLLDSAVPPGTDLDYVIRREDILMETISIHADGDPSIVNQCADPAVSRWEGGSNGDPVWSEPNPGDPCKTKFRSSSPPLSDDFVLAHWTRSRGAGSLLAFFEPWTGVTFGSFNDEGFTDISYTQLGKYGTRPFAAHHRHFMAQLGSSAAATIPQVKSVSDALPYALDYRAPYAEALVGTLEVGPEIAEHGFNPGTGVYGLSVLSDQAVILFDASGGDRTALAYKSPVVMLSGLSGNAANLSVEISTDGGNSFAPLGPSLYNLTSQADEAALGAGRRLFHYLADIPSTATGAAAVAFRFSALTGASVPALSGWGVALALLVLAAGATALLRTKRPRR